MKKTLRFGLSFLFIALALLNTIHAEDGAVYRLGVFVGANDGGAERAKLQWAVSDARRMAQVLQELGGIQKNDTLVLTQPKVSEILGVLKQYNTRIKSMSGENRRNEFVFYYSGHSDDKGLLIGKETLAYAELRKALSDVQADVSIAILDSCSSGAFTRTKGGVRIQPFLIDQSSNMKGYAFLTSSSEDEASQESDTLGASFFTHFMISGLRGAADASGDGRVTLNEAYHYAFNETLARTEDTKAGPQHASYDIQLKGSGDLILSDLSKPESGIILTSDLKGRFFIREEKGQLVAEVQKNPDITLQIALKPGTYIIRQELEGIIQEATVSISSKKLLELKNQEFIQRQASLFRTRGNDDEEIVTSLETEILSAIEDAILRGGPVLGAELVENITNLVDLNDKKNTEKTTLILPEDADQSNNSAAGYEIDYLLDTLIFNFSFLPGLGSVQISTAQTSIISISPLIGLAHRNNGLALTGLGLINTENLNGAAIAGLANYIGGTSNGALLAGLFNVGNGELRGAQISGLFNINNDDVYGAQISGLFNVSGGTVHGVQIGLINYAASMKGVPIGLFSWVQDGIHEIKISNDSDNDLLDVSLLNGTKYAYSRFSFMAATDGPILETAQNLEQAELGFNLGGRIGGKYFFADIDAGVKRFSTGLNQEALGSLIGTSAALPLTPENLRIIPNLNLSLGTEFFLGIGIWLGWNFDLLIPSLADFNAYEARYTEVPEMDTLELPGLDTSRLYNRFTAGLRFRF